MAIKNYTTSISFEKTIMEIEGILVSNHATDIFKQYEDGVPKRIAFAYKVNDKYLNFVLPMEAKKLFEILKKSNKVPHRLKTLDQAHRVGWRVIKDWIDSQMALIQINAVKFEQVFLPYLYDMQNNETLFDKIERKGFDLQIENKTHSNGRNGGEIQND